MVDSLSPETSQHPSVHFIHNTFTFTVQLDRRIQRVFPPLVDLRINLTAASWRPHSLRKRRLHRDPDGGEGSGGGGGGGGDDKPRRMRRCALRSYDENHPPTTLAALADDMVHVTLILPLWMARGGTAAPGGRI
ncbi:hypothetical protein CPLU01_12301 [Colletotrichum plurivorum]|uniref:Uncharacterized protein n=1 Tax=Colletotrichum plurivorum TaxID=2175906 RepID=A0A8H6JZK6_9PEZI|nr:hypothetical protein CPLU01_12301 [Colletotrichum plurivorum]